MVDTEEELPEIDFDEDFSIDQNEENRQTFVQVDINPSLDESERDEEERKDDDYGQEEDNPREIDSDDEAEAELFALLLQLDNEDHHAARRSAFKIPVKSERRITIARLINQHMAAMQIEEEEKIVEVQIVEEE